MVLAPIATLKGRAAAALAEFLRLESAGGVLLLGMAMLGLAAANSPLAMLYGRLLSLPFTVKLGSLGVDKPLLLWINDGLMAVFFLLVALELKREILQGQFSERAQIALPAMCAAGGMVVPMLIYAAFSRGNAEAMAGVAIPAATDIAFALAILALLGERVPIGLKLLLTAIAVLDDLGAIVIIALFYTAKLSLPSLCIGLVALAGLVLLNRTGITRRAPCLLLGLVMWVAVLKSGVHATLAGVALGMTIPISDPREPERSPLGNWSTPFIRGSRSASCRYSPSPTLAYRSAASPPPACWPRCRSASRSGCSPASSSACSGEPRSWSAPASRTSPRA